MFRSLRRFVAFHTQNRTLALLLWSAGLLLALSVFGPMALGFPVLGMAFAMRIDRELRDREAEGRDREWRVVRVGDEHIHTISDAALSDIERAAYFDPRTHVHQALNLASVGARMISQFIVYLPISALLGAILIFILAPSDAFALVDSVRELTREQIILSMPSVRSVLTVTFLLFVPVMFAMGWRFGFMDAYAHAREHALRSVLGLREFEPLQLVRVDQDAMSEMRPLAG